GKAYFSGLRSVTFEQISAIPVDRDTLMSAASLEVTVKVLPLLSGTIKLARVALSNASSHFSKHDSIRNYDFLFRKKSTDSVEKTNQQPLALAQVANRMVNNVLYKIPDNMEMRQFEI